MKTFQFGLYNFFWLCPSYEKNGNSHIQCFSIFNKHLNQSLQDFCPTVSFFNCVYIIFFNFKLNFQEIIHHCQPFVFQQLIYYTIIIYKLGVKLITARKSLIKVFQMLSNIRTTYFPNRYRKLSDIYACYTANYCVSFLPLKLHSNFPLFYHSCHNPFYQFQK